MGFKLGSEGWTGFGEQVKREAQGEDGVVGLKIGIIMARRARTDPDTY